MTSLTPEMLRALVTEAQLAPSIHNIQPTRWRALPDNRLMLIDDMSVRASCADPTGHDVRLSHGAALEGMSVALNRRGMALVDLVIAEDRLSAQYVSLCTMTTAPSVASDPLLPSVLRRMSWRSTFASSPNDDVSFEKLGAAREDIICIRDRSAISKVADWAHQADLSFLRRADFRSELLEWMRLSTRHPLYQQSGLNREALAMNALEAVGAGLVLGALFASLDRIGLVSSLVSDRAKTLSAAGVVLFFRPRGEDPLITGRHFYRAWLEIDRAGFAACPISALADHPGFNEKLVKLGQVHNDMRLVNVFRIGRPAQSRSQRHFRLPVDRIIV